MNKMIVGIALLALTIAVPVAGMAADDQTLSFGALQNLSGAQETTEATPLTPLQDADLAAVEGGTHFFEYYNLSTNESTYNFYDRSIGVFQSTFLGNNVFAVEFN